MSSKPDWAAKLVKILAQSNYQPLNLGALAKKLHVGGKYEREVAAALQELELHGRVARIREDCWVLPKEADLVTGVLSFNPKGFAFLIREDKGDDLFVAAEDTHTALHQDTVVARIVPGTGRFAGKPRARVIRILKRRHTTLVGTLEKSGRFYQVVPADPRFLQNLYVPAPSAGDAVRVEVGDVVVARLEEWRSRHHNPEGEIIERLGRKGDPYVDIVSIIRKFELPDEFPAAALAEVAALPPAGGDAPCADLQRRLDLRKELVCTIDPDTARDFDDAIHVRRLERELWEVGVHIADVAYYVRPGSELDREAARRGNSVYLVNQVIPMLPEELSNGLCSLNPNVDRLTVSVIATLTARGEVVRYQIRRSVIHSQHRLTYQQAFALLQKKSAGTDLERMLQAAWRLAAALRKRRFAAGALDLDMPEVKVYCNEHGVPTAITKVTHDLSHQLIEEFMLLANEVVATDLMRARRAAIYRVHENPDPAKLRELRETLRIHGVRVGDLTRKREVQKALNLIAGRDEAHALKVAVLRSLKRAVYDVKPLGHYGLAKANYAHFTSPIRRYADLVVHRALEQKSQGKGFASLAELERVAKHLSDTERVAADAEHESVELKKLEFFANQLRSDRPQSFPAIIMSVENYGMFVELPDFLLSGLIHISSLKDDFYYYDTTSQSFIGKKFKRQYRVGQTIKVKVARIDQLKRQVDFTVVK
ncbi:MAG: ribonuclease R [Verrucomicrobiales bacterium]|jgi:ribonuclease R|nr:ribonuclease R [Verrucomicrobiales bacterium]